MQIYIYTDIYTALIKLNELFVCYCRQMLREIFRTATVSRVVRTLLVLDDSVAVAMEQSNRTLNRFAAVRGSEVSTSGISR